MLIPTAVRLPSLYLSHGSPMIALEPGAAGVFMQGLGAKIDARFGRPRAVLVVSPHTSTSTPLLLAGTTHRALHDFGGFPDALYALRYDAPGAPDVAAWAQRELQQAGIAARCVAEGGMDHGIWTVLRHMWPAADVPVLPLSLVADWPPALQWRVGQALAGLREQGVLIIGSGSLTHNLRLYFSRGADTNGALQDSLAFSQWVAQRVAADDVPALLDYRAQAPAAARMHPTDEHWLPFYIAAGAASGAEGQSLRGVRIHSSMDGVLAMDAYAFGEDARALMESAGMESAG